MKAADMLADILDSFGQLLEAASARAGDPPQLKQALEQLEAFQNEHQEQLITLVAQIREAGPLPEGVVKDLANLSHGLADLETRLQARLAWSDDLDNFIRGRMEASTGRQGDAGRS